MSLLSFGADLECWGTDGNMCWDMVSSLPNAAAHLICHVRYITYRQGASSMLFALPLRLRGSGILKALPCGLFQQNLEECRLS